MKFKFALSTALFAASFASHAELKMSIFEQHNGVVVTAYQDGKRLANAQVTTNIRGQQVQETTENGRAFFYKGNIPRVYQFKVTNPDGESIQQSRFIGRDK
ncbi:hypothetical protein BCV39_00440 [Vibrio sp. 10N.286.55.E10]|uniref:hypothetical protein n=1 Tax=Vibrio TaxID=662 RepID=UPI000C85DE79|nr:MULTISPECIES: hypothetical protein [Vibrio]PME28332.1 hypothetical protein BCV40_16410 [Vibrio sp. 10N.286.55.E12]PME38853.1 hypothetical protein BCV39_00440 [Vibrio sp. 10N.286.55.E10]PME68294.1 hypothetical protein BCV32_12865 [Vibrio sp. 10N.286.55.C11]PMI22172.1 hypothetical protein BCU50_11690 [Vibrio sp. 10N.286.46.E10]PMI90519.1 hypothetical protein BCU34_22415 [Vibrio sp. 10N.286.45.E10]